MMCPRCHRQMLRKKSRIVENTFYYECPKCGYSLGKPLQEDDEKETNEVLNILLGEDSPQEEE